MTTFTVTIYEYIGEDFGFSFASAETGRTTLGAELESRNNPALTVMITKIDLASKGHPALHTSNL